MTGGNEDVGKSRLTLTKPGQRLELGKTVDGGSVRQAFTHGRSKVVQVEVRKTRVVTTKAPTPQPTAPAPAPAGSGTGQGQGNRPQTTGQQRASAPLRGPAPRQLTAEEKAVRMRALEQQRIREQEEAEKLSILSAAEAKRRAEEDARRKAEEEEARLRAEAEEARRRVEAEAEAKRQAEAPTPPPQQPARAAPPSSPSQAASPRQSASPAPSRPSAPSAAPPGGTLRLRENKPEDESRPRRPAMGGLGAKKPIPTPPKKPQMDRAARGGKIDVERALDDADDKVRSISSVRRARERERQKAELERLRAEGIKVVREVVIPEAMTVQELANRMATRGGDVVKTLMKLGIMATITQTIDADTAELVVTEFGHRARRVADSDVEQALEVAVDTDLSRILRPPVVTVMGHVDHGKTSLLDALRSTDVAAGEAGGITQHIGAYQVKLPGGQAITFIDTPGHEAFTAMRARGAGVTDMVILVVAADDGVMPQTIEAIKHAQAAKVPMIVAINKIDKEGVNPGRVRNELLQHEVVVEELGGDTQEIQVSALKRLGLDKLEEAILLQAEVLDLRANPDRQAEGTVIESRLDRGRGAVATVLVQKGTLRVGDNLVAGAEWGRVRAMLDDKGRQVKEAGPSTPVEVLGLTGVPSAGEKVQAVEDEAKAREISEFRQGRDRSARTTLVRGGLDAMLARIAAGEQKEVALVVKADVQGSQEAIGATVAKLGNDEVKVRVLHSAVGAITESDVTLAKASSAIIVAFNVRATSQARDLAAREGVDIRYYSIIYEVADDVEKLVKGRLAPIQREKFLGYAEIRAVFDITKTGKVAGCMITEGIVKRGAGVRLLREKIVIHQGELSTLRRFKEDVKEVREGFECGMSFANYSDIRVGDQIECYETETVAAG